MPAELASLPSTIEVRVIIDRSGETPITRGTYSCRCGWLYEATGRNLVLPLRVKDHARLCSWAHTDQLSIDDAIGGAP